MSENYRIDRVALFARGNHRIRWLRQRGDADLIECRNLDLVRRTGNDVLHDNGNSAVLYVREWGGEELSQHDGVSDRASLFSKSTTHLELLKWVDAAELPAVEEMIRIDNAEINVESEKRRATVVMRTVCNNRKSSAH